MSRSSELSQAEIRDFPKIDLHRHLLGSARPETLWELARRYDLDEGRQPLAEFERAIVHRAPPHNLSDYIRPWALFRQIIRTPEDVRRIAFEAAVDAREEGVRYVEFRSSLPGMPLTDGKAPQTQIPAKEYLQAIRDAFSAVPGVACRLVASVMRHAAGAAGPDLARRYSDAFLNAVMRHGEGLIVGVDLTGLESGWPANLFSELFASARSLGLPVTVHAGETEGPEEVWAALDELGASRIGHGTSAPLDARLIEELNKRRVFLEVCPTSGWLVGRVTNRLSHPVIECVPPLPYVICTDNPTLNASTQGDELALAARIARADMEAFMREQFELASQAAFAPPALMDAIRRDSGEPSHEVAIG